MDSEDEDLGMFNVFPAMSATHAECSQISKDPCLMDVARIMLVASITKVILKGNLISATLTTFSILVLEC